MEQFVTEASWKAADNDPGTLEGYLSVFDHVDLQDDVVERGAFKKTLAERVNRTGIPLLADHEPSVTSVIGTITQGSEDSRGLRVRASFASTPDAQAVRTKMLEGHVRAMSMGYEPKDVDERVVDGKVVRLLKQVKLWEGSVVVFPANTEALVNRVKSAVRRELRTLTGGKAPEFNLSMSDADARDLFVSMKRAVAGVSEETADGDGTRVDIKTAISSHDTATTGGEWDGPENEAQLRNDAESSYYRRAFAHVDPDANADTKAAYSFIHHEVSADGDIGPANITACVTGIGVLNGARGGSNVPESERRGVYNHLAAHLRDAGEEPPNLDSSADAGVEPSAKTSHHGDEPTGEPTSEVLSLAAKLARGEALLHGRDPDEVADPARMAGITSRLTLLDSEVDRLRRVQELDERITRDRELREQLSGRDR